MKPAIRILFLACATLPVFAHADDLSFRYAEGGLEWLDGDGQSYVGPKVRAAFSVSDKFHVFGGMRLLSDDLDYDHFWFGGALHTVLDPKTVAWGGLSVENQEVSFDRGGFSGTADDTALGLRGGLRHQMNERIELATSARYVTGDFDYFGLSGTMRYDLSGPLKLLGELDIQDGDLSLTGGISYMF